MFLKRISLQIEVNAGLPSIAADRTGVEQVMINLLRNAADAITSENHASRSVKVRSFRRDPNWIAIAVSDTGKGIDQSNHDRIFEPLFTTNEKGTGMGLAIVRSIVESYGGEIRVLSAPGRGATFEFTLPVAGQN